MQETSPDQPPRMPSQSLRASDAERDRAAAELGEHFQAGRLGPDEFDERLTAALSARTRGELAALLADLPELPHPAPLPAGGGREPVAMITFLLLPLMAVVVIAGAGQGGIGLWWVVFLAWLGRLVVLGVRGVRGAGGSGGTRTVSPRPPGPSRR